MFYKPILIVAGEPNSVFLEIFFKSFYKNKYKSPLIIIASKKLLQEQMRKLGFVFKINLIDENFNEFNKLNNKKINLIDVKYKFKNCFEKISSKSNTYIKKFCPKLFLGLINIYLSRNFKAFIRLFGLDKFLPNMEKFGP